MNDYQIMIVNDTPALLNEFYNIFHKRFKYCIKVIPERREPDFKTVIEALDNLSHHPKSMPDLVVLDMDIYGEEEAGIIMAENIERLYPRLPIIFVSAYGNRQLISRAIKVPTVKGYFRFLEESQNDALLQAAENILKYGTYQFDQGTMEDLVLHYRELLLKVT